MSTMQTTAPPATWEDVLRMPDDGNRYEFIGGRLYMTPAPVIRHHFVSQRLESALRRTLERTGRGLVFDAPVLVEFPGAGDRVQPDIFFVSNERRRIVGERQVTGAPDLMVEILSPSTAHRDRGVKLDLYARRGVREYWIVEPVEDVVDAWRFGDASTHGTLRGRAPGPAGSRARGHDRPERSLLAAPGWVGGRLAVAPGLTLPGVLQKRRPERRAHLFLSELIWHLATNFDDRDQRTDQYGWLLETL